IVSAVLIMMCGCTDYDAKIPDTKSNKNAFERQFKIKSDGNATDIYFYADEFIKDPTYFYSFTASQKIIDHIVQLYSLKKNTEDKIDGYFPPPKFPWWNKKLKLQSNLYEYRNEKLRAEYTLWYHRKSQTCQFQVIYY
ncbi:MAG: hypothetical protein PHW79_11940, partial [Candidatus Marinimicrobia bacterium]|nr:hypothetical protein [Candidatus Neomarinimicrobiota bacterium]